MYNAFFKILTYSPPQATQISAEFQAKTQKAEKN
jgi:hypothetical protein